MLLEIRHETVHHYSAEARYGIQSMRLVPRGDGGQRVRHWRIEAPGRRWRQTDAFGNIVETVSLVEPHQQVRIVAFGEVETPEEAGALFPADTSVPPLAFAVATVLTAADESIGNLGREAFGDHPGPAKREAFLALMAAVHDGMAYERGSTHVHAPAASAWALGKGVYQDMAHVFLAACRAMMKPARYVSGYALGDSPKSGSHAWVEVWIAEASRGAGAWLGLDVANNALAGPGLCRLAVGRDYMDAGPIRGARLGGGEETLEVEVVVRQLA